MKNIRYAFTMIELVFVIVVLGILSAVAIPKLSNYIDDANYATALATISSIRSAIASERQSNLIRGSVSYPPFLDDAETGEHEKLFDGNGTAESDVHILQYPIYSGSEAGNWKKTSDNDASPITYDYYVKSGRTIEFTYTKETGVFDCDHTKDDCKLITE